MLKSEKCNNFEDLKIISRENYSDQRGEFLNFNFDDLKEFGWVDQVKQINFSQTLKKVLLEECTCNFQHMLNINL